MSKKLRVIKAKAHSYFDPLWQNKVFNKNRSLSYNRKQAYKWLSIMMNIPESKCHIGLFDVDTCRKVIKICKRKQVEEGIYINEYAMSKRRINK